MKIGVYGRQDIVTHLQAMNSNSHIQSIQSKEQLLHTTDFDGIIVVQHDMNPLEISALRENHPQLHLLVLLQEEDRVLQQLCLMKGMQTLPANRAPACVQQVLEHNWFVRDYPMKTHHIISISGTHPQVGTTQASISLAMALKEHQLKVCVLGLNVYNPGELLSNEQKHSLDSLYSSLEHGILTSAQFQAMCTDIHGIDYLIGSRSLTKWDSYEVEPIRYLIKLAASIYDHVILDMGAFYHHAPAIASLYEASHHILIATQQQISIDQFTLWKQQVLHNLEAYTTDFYLMINKYDAKQDISPNYIAQALDMHLLCVVPHIPVAENIMLEKGILWNQPNKEYRKPFMEIAHGFMPQEHLLTQEKSLHLPTFLRRWFAS